ncbi:hypothetical protein [Pseudomonas sp. Z3-6]|uniref:hypothetical protein n=1 Tax=Pseudomonas sp. Z3-6 TaxID=2817411 RepID=UPI003DA7A975
MNKRQLANGQDSDGSRPVVSGEEPWARALRQVYQGLRAKPAQRLLKHLHGVCVDTVQVRQTMTTTKSREC